MAKYREAIPGRFGDATHIITPHVFEFARLAGVEPASVLENRFEIGAELAGRTGATILLKGVPTVVTNPAAIDS